MRWVAFPALWVVASLPIFASETVLPPDELRGHLTEFKLREETLNRRIEENPENLSALSARGDARMFLGNFEGAREDYAKMIELDPTLEVSHWRI